MNIQGAEMQRSRHRKGDFTVCLPPSPCTGSSTQKLPEPCAFEISIEVSSNRHDRLLTQFPVPLPF